MYPHFYNSENCLAIWYYNLQNPQLYEMKKEPYSMQSFNNIATNLNKSLYFLFSKDIESILLFFKSFLLLE